MPAGAELIPLLPCLDPQPQKIGHVSISLLGSPRVVVTSAPGPFGLAGHDGSRTRARHGTVSAITAVCLAKAAPRDRAGHAAGSSSGIAMVMEITASGGQELRRAELAGEMLPASLIRALAALGVPAQGPSSPARARRAAASLLWVKLSALPTATPKPGVALGSTESRGLKPPTAARLQLTPVGSLAPATSAAPGSSQLPYEMSVTPVGLSTLV